MGEGGGRLAMSMAQIDFNVGAINTARTDLNGLTEIPESKKLLVEISEGGSGKDPKFVKSALAGDVEHRKKISAFISNLIKSTPLFTVCSHCKAEQKLKDTEAVGESHICTKCNNSFGIQQVLSKPDSKHNYLFIFACLGGGSGSGLIADVIDICYTNFDIPIAVVCTLPDDSEDTIAKINAISIFKELYNKYAVPQIISPFILIDNQKMMEMYDLPLGSMYSTINKSVAEIIQAFDSFSNKTSKYMTTIDVMDTARLWSLGGCCALGKFTVGNNNLKKNKYELNVESFFDFDLIEQAMKDCAFVDGFDLSSAQGVGVIVVAPEHFLQDEAASKCIKYVYGKAKELIGDGTIFRGQYDDSNADSIEFFLFFNGLKYPEERFDRMWKAVKEGKAISDRKRQRIDGMNYEIGLESAESGKNFKRMQGNLGETPKETQSEVKRFQKKECTNCYLDPTTKKSMGVYRKGGPRPFTGKICPVCNGSGKE